MKIVVTIAVIALIFAVSLAFRKKIPAAAVPGAGAAAPDFTLTAQDGTPVSLKDFRGKWIVLYFYPKDLTPGCTIEARNFQRDLSQYDRRNAVILGVSVQDADSHKNFCAKEGLNFKLLADRERKASAAYGSLADFLVTTISARHTFLIDPAGQIAKVYEEVRVGSHSEQILADLDLLQKDALQKTLQKKSS